MCNSDQIKCMECGRLFLMIKYTHLKYHNLTREQYLLKYPGALLISSECRRKISISHKSSVRNNVHMREMSNSNIGKIRSLEHRLHLSHSLKSSEKCKSHCRDIAGNRKGKFHSLDSKLRISITRRNPDCIKKYIESRIRNSSYHFETGKFYSEKNDKEIYWQASYEYVVLSMLELREDVLKFDRCTDFIKYTFLGEDKLYHPDFYIEFTDGKKLTVEIKPINFITDEQVIVKAKFAKEFYNARDISYEIWTEREIWDMARKLGKELIDNGRGKLSFAS